MASRTQERVVMFDFAYSKLCAPGDEGLQQQEQEELRYLLGG